MRRDGIDWKADYEAALAEARGNGRLVVVHFALEGRPLGREMAEQTFAHPGVVAASRGKFLCVRIDIARQPDLFQKTLGTKGGLGTAVVDGTGDVVSALPGFAAPEAYLAFLEKAARGYPALRAARDGARADDAASLYALGEAYESLDSPRRAEEEYARAVALGAKDPKPLALAHERLARIFALRGKNREAREHLAEFRRLDGGNAFGRDDRALLTEGMILSLELKLEACAKHLEAALAKYPSGAESDQMLLLLGVTQHELKQPKAAMATLERLLREFPRSAWGADARLRIEHIKNPPPGHDH
jgi:tetratricopeptide (TPR) repeat protein